MPALQAYVDGVVIPASQLTQRDPLFAMKPSDQQVNNNATFQNDNALFLTVAPNATYKLIGHLVQNSGATPGFKFSVLLPAGATFQPGTFQCGSSAANLQFGVMPTSAAVAGVTGAGADSVADFTSTIVIGVTGGVVQVQWAQNTANASNTIVRAGSTLELRQVA